MIIVRAPLRISLFGGGSDLPAFFESEAGEVLSFSINKYVYLIAHPFTHRSGIVLKYSKFEDVQNADEISHPIFRQVLTDYGLTNLDIAVMSDVPAGTGMGSSSAFTVALLALARRISSQPFSSSDLAREACEVEILKLNEPIGIQDQWASALGGINHLTFNGFNEVKTESIQLSANDLAKLNQNLVLVPVGEPRSASQILRQQGKSLIKGSAEFNATSQLKSLVTEGKRALYNDMDQLGTLLDESWKIKKGISKGISNSVIEDTYELGLNSGATGGKLLGAGGSGFFAFYVPENNQARFKEKFKKTLEYNISLIGVEILNEVRP